MNGVTDVWLSGKRFKEGSETTSKVSALTRFVVPLTNYVVSAEIVSCQPEESFFQIGHEEEVKFNFFLLN